MHANGVVCRQGWVCVDCNKKGEFEFQRGELNHEVLPRVENSHREASPSCQGKGLAVETMW